MKTRALFALGALALCLTLGAGFASADGATATLSVNGGLTGTLHISGAPSGLYTVHELMSTGYVLVGTGLVDGSGNSTTLVTLLPTQNPSFVVRIRALSGLTVIPVMVDPDPLWWWD
jgi:hypothetical protein